MFNSVSKAGAGISIMAFVPGIIALLSFFGVEITESDLVQLFQALAVIVGFILTVIGQLDRRDLKYGLFRK